MKNTIYGATALSLMVAAALALGGCAKSDTPGDTHLQVTLVATLDNAAQAAPGLAASANPAPPTRTTDGGDSWTAGDRLGLFMLEGGGTLPGGLITVGGTKADNREYSITDPVTGTMAPEDGGDLWYPQTGTVAFIAYYPWRDFGPGNIDRDNYTLPVDVSDQSAPASIDLLWAKAEGVSRSKTAVNLLFEHRLSKLTLNLKAGDGITAAHINAMTGANVVVDGMPTGAVFGLQGGDLTVIPTSAQPLALYKEASATAGYDATFTAILLPRQAGAGCKVTFTVDGKEFVWNIPGGDAFDRGDNNVYPVTVKRTGLSVGPAVITAWDDTAPATEGVTEPKL